MAHGYATRDVMHIFASAASDSRPNSAEAARSKRAMSPKAAVLGNRRGLRRLHRLAAPTIYIKASVSSLFVFESLQSPRTVTTHISVLLLEVVVSCFSVD